MRILSETLENSNNEDQILVVSFLGRDRPGLVHGVTRVIAKYNANIVDIDQTVLRGLFAMFLLVDIGYINDSVEKFLAELKEVSAELGLVLTIEPWRPGRRKSEKDLYCLTLIGKDRPGIIATFSEIFGETDINIEQIRMIARGEVIATEMILDVSDSKLSISFLREKLENTGGEMGLSLVIQPKYVHEMQKRLIVFDMDNTLVSGEIVDEMAEATGVQHKVKELTSKAMNGEISFEEALRERVLLLKGTKIEILESISKNIIFTPGAKELIRALKAMGYKLALISGGFTYFTDRIKKQLGLDYAFGNKLVIQDGILTGQVEGPIIDADAKWRIVKKIAEREGISKEEIVTVGDGSNDMIMVENAGLGIGFNPKPVLTKVASGIITNDSLTSLLFVLGLKESELAKAKEKISKQNSSP